MLSLERTEEGITVCGRLARLIPSKSWFFSFHMKSTESPATSLLALTKTLQPVVSRCRLGWPVKNSILLQKIVTWHVQKYKTTKHNY
jgi:hypothetical protein